MDLSNMMEDAARGAAAGSVFPGVGTALGAVGGIVLDLAPEVGRWLFGPEAATTVSAVHAAVSTVTGSPDPDIQAASLADPGKAAALRVELARIASERAAAAATSDHAALVAQLGDVANARATTVQLARDGSSIAWGAPTVSVVVLLTFAGVMGVALTHTMPAGAEPVLNVLIGSLGAMTTSVVSYWVGSSAGFCPERRKAREPRRAELTAQPLRL